MAYQPPRGTRDFPPETMIKREYVIETIKSVFSRYGFMTMDGPAIEYWEVLSKKGGDDAIKDEIYYFRDRGERELGLRFDLTVSLARFASSNPQLVKPFKVQRIGRVWRYDRPQSGRYREFWQADIDIIGSSSLECETECIATATECLDILGFNNFIVRINSRKLLNGIVGYIGCKKKVFPEIMRTLDKLDKIGKEAVEKEIKKIVGNKAARMLMKVIEIRGETETVAKKCLKLMGGYTEAKEGIREVQEISDRLKAYGMNCEVVFDISLVRGLDYYTGPIFEIYIKGMEQIGSVGGGGRYDNLIEAFGGKWTPATGISLGVERIIDIMEKKGMFSLPETKTDVFVVSVDESVKDDAIKIAQKLRSAGIIVETDVMARSMKKQLDYVNKKKIPYALIIGPREVKRKKYVLKEMSSGTQTEMRLERIIRDFIKAKEQL